MSDTPIPPEQDPRPPRPPRQPQRPRRDRYPNRPNRPEGPRGQPSTTPPAPAPASPRPRPALTPQRRLWEVLEPAAAYDRPSRLFDWALITIILLNVVAIVLESIDSIRNGWAVWLTAFEWFSVAVFTVEYLARIWSCVTDPRYARGALSGRLKFALSPMALIDLLAILPAYLPMLGVDLRVLRGLRLMRFFRLLKVGRYSQAPALILRVVRDRREELLVSAGIMLVLLFIAATLMFYCEHDAQPEVFSSIPAALWWAITTVTTVGYGDVVPITAWGRLAGGFVAILGICFFALPTALLGAGFLEALRHRHEPRPGKCPRCGYRP